MLVILLYKVKEAKQLVPSFFLITFMQDIFYFFQNILFLIIILF
ncbi:hypothetical protein LE164_08715 [Staphylococcus lugdunensis]|nr:hypothetical protein LE189_11865 [Staphylococcus lugdunensis]UZW84234.1 hypothetical protein LE167_05670 [Staphylococcus lugdunensis]UZW84909.1 hypothetical protein LE164_08715 [Staphylococcus lugdunensis]UZW88982.1 hypothetical protein LE166_05380 [Staphylococcus lugdunensis]UZW90484.1 hypothetical protein LE165_00470 [Staphylococcus lugdunensis]